MVGVGRRGNAGVVLSVALLAGVLTGCGPSSDTVTEVTEPPPDPGLVFDSDEEALAAAEEAVLWSINTDLAMDVEDEAAIEEYLETLTPGRRDEQRQAFEALKDDQLETSGQATLSRSTLTSRDVEDEVIDMRFCLDLSRVTMTTEAGESAQIEDVPRVQMFVGEVRFTSLESFQVGSIEPAGEEPGCESE